VNFRPPAPPRPKASRWKSTSYELVFGSVRHSWSNETSLAFCARSPRIDRLTVGMTVNYQMGIPLKAGNLQVHPAIPIPSIEFGHSQSQTNQHSSKPLGLYVIVGIMSKEESIPHEILLSLQSEDLFTQIRKAERRLRGPLRRLLSLKRVGAFGLYKCHPSQDYHSTPDISNETKRCLSEFYRNYRSEKADEFGRWGAWIQTHFNNASDDPEEGTYALQLVLSWSPVKLVLWSSAPILLSLVVGFWYMFRAFPGEDHVAVVQTAWSIASYIVTAAAFALAIVAAITQIGDA